ncbi:MAG: hypothetical protein AMS22_10410 [Thiotrichales bacterium SG8_50]|nr:MAG: hypothetical protein AMS22_10410 [Thiotrichales bacterium SG8_50]
MVKARPTRAARVAQGDIIRDVEYIEHVSERNGELQIEKIVFPLVVVLTQDCDLAQDYRFRWSRQRTATEDKLLLSVLVAPLYNAEHVFSGDHLSDLGMKMVPINRSKTPGENLRKNETHRYHYLEFSTEIPIVPSVIDFKHYFSVNAVYLKRLKARHFVCRLSSLYREDVAQRFASFLARIALPD